jgi:hypothetical protein
MAENNPQRTPTQAARRRPSLYRTVLSLGIAAIAATWLPFSFLYINALSHHATTVSTTQTLHTAPVTAGPQAATLTPVTTRTS